MQPRSEYPTSRFRAQLLAGALALGLAWPLLSAAQEPRGSAKDLPRPDAKTAAANPQPDAQGARARWRAQQIATRTAEAEYHTARLAREIAELMLLEYEEGIASQDIAAADGEIKLAESDLKRAVRDDDRSASLKTPRRCSLSSSTAGRRVLQDIVEPRVASRDSQ